MTRNWPMKDVAGEEQDHPHHRSLWFAHGAVNGIDFWSEDSKAGRIVHDKFLEVKSGASSGVIRSANKWIAAGGEVVCTDETTFRVYARPDSERLFDFEQFSFLQRTDLGGEFLQGTANQSQCRNKMAMMVTLDDLGGNVRGFKS